MRASEPGQHLHLILVFPSTYSNCVGLLMCATLSQSGTLAGILADEMTEGKLTVKFASLDKEFWNSPIYSF